jgi:predicted dehydrogenase
MSPVRIAVVGVGYLGRFHAQKQKALNPIGFAGVADSQFEVAEAVARELDTKAWPDYKELLGKVDGVIIASSTSSHFEIADFFLNHNVHVFVEKPITSTTDQARHLVEVAKKNNLNLQVGHVERFNPALVAAQSRLKQPLFIECERLAPFKPRSLEVDVILDLMIHDLDLVLSLVKSEPVHIAAVGTPVITSHIDIANARIEFANGAVANITASRVSSTGQRKVRVFQPSQYLSIDFGSGEIKLVSKKGDYAHGAELPLETEIWNLDKGDALLGENKAFLESIATGQAPIVSGKDGLEALVLAERILNAIV